MGQKDNKIYFQRLDVEICSLYAGILVPYSYVNPLSDNYSFVKNAKNN